MTAGDAKGRRPGHWWAWGIAAGDKVVRYALVRVHRVYGRGPYETFETSDELSASLMTCEQCGLLAAEWVVVDRADGTQRTLHAVGFDLDALAVMGSAPPCEPFALSRPPHAPSPPRKEAAHA